MTEYKRKYLTLCMVHQPPHVLLGMKKRGFGAGRWNGFGGKVDTGERIEEAAIREVREEIGIDVSEVEKVGVLEFSFEKSPREVLEVNVFKTSTFSGDPVESDEMRPQWFHESEVPYDTMWPDDAYWMPLCFGGKRFRGQFHFGEHDRILRQHLEEVTAV